jgi:hypothetical protein
VSENAKFVVFNEQISMGGGTASFAPTLTVRFYGAFGTIRGLFIFVKVGARFPRPHLVDLFPGRLPGRKTENGPGNIFIYKQWNLLTALDLKRGKGHIFMD